VIESRLFRGICLLLIAACVVVRSIEGLFHIWNPIRLARAVALARGYDLYTPPDNGVIAGLIYGPVGFLVYAPAALWSTPLPALVTAGLISMLVTLGPALLLLSDRKISEGARAWIAPVFLLLVLHFYASRATPGIWMIHTDAGALGLVCLALYWTLQHPPNRSYSWQLAASALCAALAVWAKQTVAPVLLIPGLYFLWRGWRSSAAWMMGLTAGFAGVFGAIFSAVYGFDHLWLAMIAVPSGHQLHLGAPVHEWRLITDFVEMVYLLGVVVSASVAVSRAEPGGGPAPGGAWFSRWAAYVPDWAASPLLFATGLALLPMALLGLMKAGGTANNIGLVDYFLALGIAVLFLRLAAHPEFRHEAGRRALQASVLVLLIVMALRTSMAFVRFARETPKRWPPPAQVAYEYARKHPGTVYFPWHTLSTLMGEGRYDHTAWGVMERETAGFPVSETHFRQGLPNNLQRIAVIDEDHLTSAIEARNWGHYLLRRLPEFRCRITVPELPGWLVLERGGEDCGHTTLSRVPGSAP
jgi:hypothetical protein